MNDDRLLLEMRRWLQEEPVVLPDAEEAGRRIASHVPRTRQRRRRWWRSPFRTRTPWPPRTRGTAPYEADPVPATNGQTPITTGRISSMLSPAKAVIVAALAVAIGGAFLVAQPFDQQATTIPAAQDDGVSMDPAWVTGSVLHAPACTQPERTIDDDVVHAVGYRCESQIWETDDPRLSGTATPSWNEDVYRLSPDVSVATGIVEVETDSGRWLCSSGPRVAQGSGLFVSTNPETIACDGLDAYAGLAAVLDVDLDAGSVEGLVFAGEMPQSPEPVGQ